MPLSNELLASLLKDWDAAYATAFAPQLRKQNPFAAWLGGAFKGNAQNQYLGQVSQNPNRSIMEFLTGLRDPMDAAGNSQERIRLGEGLNPMGDWMNLSPSGRGEQPSKFAPGLNWKSIFGSRG